MSKDRELSIEAALAKLKKEVRGVILSSPKGLTINQFLKDYKDSIGKTFPFQEFGYDSIPGLLRDISDVVRLNPGYGGMPSVLVPVVSDKVNHIDSMVSRQKMTSNKFAHRHVPPRRSVQEDLDSKSIRKPVQLPLESKSSNSTHERNSEKESRSKSKENLHNHNGFSDKNREYTSNYDDSRMCRNQSSYEEPVPTRNSSSNSNRSHQYQSNRTYNSKATSNKYSRNAKANSDAYSHNSDESDRYSGDEDEIERTRDYVDRSDSTFQNGIYNSESEEEFERPPTPGEVIVNEKMKNNFRRLLAEHHEGIPSSKFCKLYSEMFGTTLKYHDYGFKSFQEMIANLPDVFTFQRKKSSQQWILYDAHQPIPSDVQNWIPYDISMNISELAQNFPEGLKKTDLIFLYRERYHVDLDVKRLGFDSIESFLRSCSAIDFVSINGEDVVIPKNTYLPNTATENEQFYALPPVSEILYLWGGHFTEDECDPSMAYQPFNLIRNDKLNYAKVFACDVISPHSIWLQMDEQREELSKLMLNLNDYYDKYDDKHILSDSSFAVNDLICAVRFSMDNRWHRAKILSHIESTNSVMVRYVDYGTENTVSISSIRKLKKLFYDLPVQAVHASLFGVEPKSKDNSKPFDLKWSDESVYFIYDLCFEKKFSIDILEIDELIPKLKVIMYDGRNTLTINDQLLAAGHAVSVIGHMIKPGSSDDRRIRTPPGYSSRTPALSSPKNITSTSSTCDRINVLREESILIHKEVERLQQEIQQKMLEANVLEQLVCKHPHPPPENFESLMKLYGKLEQTAQEEAASNDLSSEHNTGFNKMESNLPASSLPKAGGRTTTFTQEPVNTFNHAHQQGFHPVQNTMASHNQAQGGPDGYNHMTENHPPLIPPQMMQHQTPHPMAQHQAQHHHQPHHHHQPQHHHQHQLQHQRPSFSNYPQQIPPNAMHNKMVGPPLIVPNQAPYMARVPPYPSYQQPQNLMYPPQNMNQWGAQWGPVVPPGMYTPYRQDVYPTNPPAVRPVFNRPSPSSCNPSVEAPVKSLSPTPKSPLEDVVQHEIQPSAPPEDEVEPIYNIEPAEEVIPPVDYEEEDEAPEVELKSEHTATPPPSPPYTYDTSHLSEKQAKKLEKSDDIVVVPPSSNNWLEAFSPKTGDFSPAHTPPVSSGDSQYPNETLLELMRDNEKSNNDILDDEYRKLDNAITDSLGQKKEAVNYIMKICVENVHGLSSNVLLVLIGDSVAILLKQLYINFWWGDLNDESYSNLMVTLKDDFSLVYSIFYPDYVPIFERLREEKCIDEDDLYVSLVNLCDVPTALDVICPSERQDLSRVKEMFSELSKMVLPVDEFWYRTEGGTSH